MSELMQKAVFIYKADNVEEIARLTEHRTPTSFCVTRVILLTDADFEKYKRADLMEDAKFLHDHNYAMWYDSKRKCRVCLLVKGETSKDGLLIESECFEYARYAAIVPDCDRLELTGVPVDTQYIPKAPTQQRKPRGGQER